MRRSMWGGYLKKLWNKVSGKKQTRRRFKPETDAEYMARPVVTLGMQQWSIEALDVPKRYVTALRKHKIERFGDLVLFTPRELEIRKGIGPQAVKAIQAALKTINLQLGMRRVSPWKSEAELQGGA